MQASLSTSQTFSLRSTFSASAGHVLAQTAVNTVTDSAAQSFFLFRAAIFRFFRGLISAFIVLFFFCLVLCCVPRKPRRLKSDTSSDTFQCRRHIPRMHPYPPSRLFLCDPQSARRTDSSSRIIRQPCNRPDYI